MQAQAAEQKADNRAPVRDRQDRGRPRRSPEQETDKRIKDAQTPARGDDRRSRSGAGRSPRSRRSRPRSSARRRAPCRSSASSTPTSSSRGRRRGAARKRRRAAGGVDHRERQGRGRRRCERLVEEYKKAGRNAREVARLPADDAAGRRDRRRRAGLKIKQLTILPSGGQDGELARKAITTAEQIKAATGIDLAGGAEDRQHAEPRSSGGAPAQGHQATVCPPKARTSPRAGREVRGSSPPPEVAPDSIPDWDTGDWPWPRPRPRQTALFRGRGRGRPWPSAVPHSDPRLLRPDRWRAALIRIRTVEPRAPLEQRGGHHLSAVGTSSKVRRR